MRKNTNNLCIQQVLDINVVTGSLMMSDEAEPFLKYLFEVKVLVLTTRLWINVSVVEEEETYVSQLEWTQTLCAIIPSSIICLQGSLRGSRSLQMAGLELTGLLFLKGHTHLDKHFYKH